jgi:hypothetical protein
MDLIKVLVVIGAILLLGGILPATLFTETKPISFGGYTGTATYGSESVKSGYYSKSGNVLTESSLSNVVYCDAKNTACPNAENRWDISGDQPLEHICVSGNYKIGGGEDQGNAWVAITYFVGGTTIELLNIGGRGAFTETNNLITCYDFSYIEKDGSKFVVLDDQINVNMVKVNSFSSYKLDSLIQASSNSWDSSTAGSYVSEMVLVQGDIIDDVLDPSDVPEASNNSFNLFDWIKNIFLSFLGWFS